MNIKTVLQLARQGRPDLVAANIRALVAAGLSIQGALRLVARLVARYPHSSGHFFHTRDEVSRARRLLRS
jgi:3-methyladenine DNA glycosylase/8-oxoguanine DNA glycosylase